MQTSTFPLSFRHPFFLSLFPFYCNFLRSIPWYRLIFGFLFHPHFFHSSPTSMHPLFLFPLLLHLLPFSFSFSFYPWWRRLFLYLTAYPTVQYTHIWGPLHLSLLEGWHSSLRAGPDVLGLKEEGVDRPKIDWFGGGGAPRRFRTLALLKIIETKLHVRFHFSMNRDHFVVSFCIQISNWFIAAFVVGKRCYYIWICMCICC